MQTPHSNRVSQPEAQNHHLPWMQLAPPIGSSTSLDTRPSFRLSSTWVWLGRPERPHLGCDCTASLLEFLATCAQISTNACKEWGQTFRGCMSVYEFPVFCTGKHPSLLPDHSPIHQRIASQEGGLGEATLVEQVAQITHYVPLPTIQSETWLVHTKVRESHLNRLGCGLHELS